MHLLADIANPFYNTDFFEFLFLFVRRLILLLTGQLPIYQLASDEIQIYTLAGISISSALVGTFLILKRMTMLANALSHTLLIGIVLAYFFGANKESYSTTFPIYLMIIASVIMALLTTFLSEFLTVRLKLQEDAGVGLVFTALFALGVILSTILTHDVHLGIEAVMGDTDALHIHDLGYVFLILGINASLFFLFFERYQITTFDTQFAIGLGISPLFFNYLLMTQVSITSVAAFRAVGVILVLALMTGPVLCARLYINRLKQLLIASSCIGVAASFISVALARHFLTVYGMALSTSAITAVMIFLFFLLCISGRLLFPNLSGKKQNIYS